MSHLGHLVAAISTNFERRIYPPVDAADKVGCRPDCAVSLYPGHMRENTSKPSQLNPHVPVTPRTPPTFLLQAFQNQRCLILKYPSPPLRHVGRWVTLCGT